jgi:chemotaxis protein MotD
VKATVVDPVPTAAATPAPSATATVVDPALVATAASTPITSIAAAQSGTRPAPAAAKTTATATATPSPASATSTLDRAATATDRAAPVSETLAGAVTRRDAGSGSAPRSDDGSTAIADTATRVASTALPSRVAAATDDRVAVAAHAPHTAAATSVPTSTVTALDASPPASLPAVGVAKVTTDRREAPETTSTAVPTAPDALAVTGSLEGARGAVTTTAVATRGEVATDTGRTVPLSDMAATIAGRSHAGHSRFDIRLSPEELGGVDVRVEVRSTGEVRAHLVVERTETLDLMLRDQRSLERQLTDAGLDVGSSGLQFSLKQQSSGESGQGWRTYDEAFARADRRTASEEEDASASSVAAVGAIAAYRNVRAGGVDLTV